MTTCFILLILKQSTKPQLLDSSNDPCIDHYQLTANVTEIIVDISIAGCDLDDECYIPIRQRCCPKLIIISI